MTYFGRTNPIGCLSTLAGHPRGATVRSGQTFAEAPGRASAEPSAPAAKCSWKARSARGIGCDAGYEQRPRAPLAEYRRFVLSPRWYSSHLCFSIARGPSVRGRPMRLYATSHGRMRRQRLLQLPMGNALTILLNHVVLPSGGRTPGERVCHLRAHVPTILEASP